MRRNLLYLLLAVLSGVALATTSFTLGQQQKVEKMPINGNRTEDIRQLGVKETAADFRGVAKKAIPAVVSIKVQSKNKSNVFKDNHSDDPLDLFSGRDLWDFFGIPKRDSRFSPLVGQASGVIVSAEGYILTNSHVVHGMDSIKVQLHDGRELTAKVLGDDPNSDLAIIKIDADHLPYLTLGNSDDLEVGQWVAAVGNPFGLQATLTVGVVSAKSRNNLDIAHYEDFIQTDVAINRGNSGGPLITLDGEVVGINTAIATNASAGYVGIGFAIPSNMAKHVMDEILAQGKVSRGLLGVNLQTIDHKLAKAFGLNKVEGALVTNVAKNSAAERAGLEAGDIILKFNDRAVENAAALRNAIYMMKPGTKLTLNIIRKDQVKDILVTLGEYTEQTAAAESGSSQSHSNRLGVEVENITPEMAQRLGYSNDQGVIITNVEPSSLAGLAGLKRNALILGVNKQKISNVQEFNEALEKSPKDAPLLLQIKQGELYMFVSLQPD